MSKEIREALTEPGYYLHTPEGKTEFSKSDTKYYKGISDEELMEKYLGERKNTRFINPKTFEVMKSRGLIYPGEKLKEIEKRLEIMKAN